MDFPFNHTKYANLFNTKQAICLNAYTTNDFLIIPFNNTMSVLLYRYHNSYLCSSLPSMLKYTNRESKVISSLQIYSCTFIKITVVFPPWDIPTIPIMVCSFTNFFHCYGDDYIKLNFLNAKIVGVRDFLPFKIELTL